MLSAAPTPQPKFGDFVSVLQVGQWYVAGRTEWPEGAGYSYAADGHVLSIFMRSPNRREVEAIRRGKCQFALVIGPDIFFLMYRFGKAIGWSGAPYWGALIPNEQRAAPPKEWPGAGAMLQVVLVSAATGLVRALRAVTLPPDFTYDLHEAIRRCALLAFAGKGAYDAALADMRRLCPTSRRLLQRAVACIGPVPREKLVHRVWLREHRLNQLFDLLNWFSRDGDDKETNLYSQEVLRGLDAELEGQGFMRVDRSFEIPHE